MPTSFVLARDLEEFRAWVFQGWQWPTQGAPKVGDTTRWYVSNEQADEEGIEVRGDVDEDMAEAEDEEITGEKCEMSMTEFAGRPYEEVDGWEEVGKLNPADASEKSCAAEDEVDEKGLAAEVLGAEHKVAGGVRALRACARPFRWFRDASCWLVTPPRPDEESESDHEVDGLGQVSFGEEYFALCAAEAAVKRPLTHDEATLLVRR